MIHRESVLSLLKRSMDNVIDLTKRRNEKKQKASMKKLDAMASYNCIEKCLFYLDMNKIPELENVKNELKKAMRKLAEMSK